MYTHWATHFNTLECILGPYKAFLGGPKKKNGNFIFMCVLLICCVYRIYMYMHLSNPSPHVKQKKENKRGRERLTLEREKRQP